MELIRGPIPTKMDKSVPQQVEHIPSIVGKGFLEEQKITLVFSPNARLACLEVPLRGKGRRKRANREIFCLILSRSRILRGRRRASKELEETAKRTA